jgi:hypothetical protein
MKKIFNPILNKSLTVIMLLMASFTIGYAQTTIVKGVITDARTHQAMPYVTVAFTGTTQGMSTNMQGQYTLTTTAADRTQIQVSFVGYKTVTRTVTPGTEQTINIALTEDSRVLNEVVVRSAKKKKYSNKNNPAVELIRQVIAHKKQNQPESYEHTEFQTVRAHGFFVE